MNPAVPPAASPSAPPRSIFVTTLGWVVIVASALGSVISFFTCLMLVAGSYGTSGGMTLEGLCIIAGPPVTLVAGTGLLRRWPWARIYLVVLLFAVLA
jgi:hypothetical protein